jgi:hypothetical protein
MGRRRWAKITPLGTSDATAGSQTVHPRRPREHSILTHRLIQFMTSTDCVSRWSVESSFGRLSFSSAARVSFARSSVLPPSHLDQRCGWRWVQFFDRGKVLLPSCQPSRRNPADRRPLHPPELRSALFCRVTAASDISSIVGPIALDRSIEQSTPPELFHVGIVLTATGHGQGRCRRDPVWSEAVQRLWLVVA